MRSWQEAVEGLKVCVRPVTWRILAAFGAEDTCDMRICTSPHLSILDHWDWSFNILLSKAAMYMDI